MDEKTKNLISLGAAVAANCIPCFEHYYMQAEAKGIDTLEVQQAVEIAEKVKNGAGIATKGFVYDTMGKKMPETNQSAKSACCG